MLTFGSLFAGIGGFDLGLERAGMACTWQVEREPYAVRVLEKHWPNVRRHDDVCTFPPAEGNWAVDLICGGFPCQDISVAGKGLGLAGKRSGLWVEMHRIIGKLRPRYVIVENVAALLSRGMETVLGDLSQIGYDAEWHVIPASAVGAPHRRERVWIVAYSVGAGAWSQGGTADKQGAWWAGETLRQGNGPTGTDRLEPTGATAGDVADPKSVRNRKLKEAHQREDRSGAGWPKLIEQCSEDLGHSNSLLLEGNWETGNEEPRSRCQKRELEGSSGDIAGWWATEPDVGRVANGVPHRVDRLRGLGNAVVPQIVELIGRAIIAHDRRPAVEPLRQG